MRFLGNALLSVLLLLPAWAQDPAPPSECAAALIKASHTHRSGGLLTLDGTPLILEGSAGKTRGVSTKGGLQPDYWIHSQDPELQQFFQAVDALAMSIAALPARDRIQAIQAYVQSRLPERSPEAPSYLALLERYRTRSELVPLGEYLKIGAGVCREFALLTHLALLRAGIPVQFAYVQHIYRGKIEDHAINLWQEQGTTWVIDSYYAAYNFQDFRTLRNQNTILRINPYPKVWDARSPLPEQPTFAEAFKSSPLEWEKKIRGRWWDLKEAARARGDTAYDELSFPLPELKPVVDTALSELQKLGDVDLQRRFAAQADQVALNGYRYRDVIAFARDWVESVEPVAAARWTAQDSGRWVSSYFKRAFGQYWDDIVLNPTQGLVFPWFTLSGDTLVDMDFFIRVRATRLYLLGMRPNVGSTDGDPLGPSDFFFHDLEHAFRQKTQTYLIIDGFERPERAALQALWERRVQNLLSERDQWSERDPEMGTAFTYLLFELLHERGFAPDYQSLRDQTLSTRWTRVIERKLLNRFWFSDVRHSPDFATLERARLALHRFVTTQAQVETHWLRGAQVAGTVRIQKPARALTGVVSAVELESPTEIRVGLTEQGKTKIHRFAEAQINLEQVFFEMPKRITSVVADAYVRALALKQQGLVRGVRVATATSLPEVYDPAQGWRELDLTAYPAAHFAQLTPLPTHTLYRLEQLASLLRTHGETDALVLQAAEVHRGVIRGGGGSGLDYALRIETIDGRQIRFRPEEAQVVAPDGL